MNVSSRCWSPFHANECVFSRNEQQKVYYHHGILLLFFNNANNAADQNPPTTSEVDRDKPPLTTT